VAYRINPRRSSETSRLSWLMDSNNLSEKGDNTRFGFLLLQRRNLLTELYVFHSGDRTVPIRGRVPTYVQKHSHMYRQAVLQSLSDHRP
jgi:hypothetical protein